MSALLQAELLKLRTTRTFVVLVGCALGLSLLVVVLTTTLGSRFTDDDIRQLFFSDFTSVFILLLGIVGMAGEWRHRTITGTILAAPDRVRFTAAKLLAYAVAGVVLSLVVTVAITLVGSLILSSAGETTLGLGALLDVLWRNALIAGLEGALGVCIGGLVRNQVVAIVGILVVGFVLEPALLALAPDVGRFGPTTGAPAGISHVAFGSDDTSDLLPTGVAVLAMLSWVGVAFAATAALLRRRDLV